MTALCSGKICTIFPEKGALNFWKACTIALEYSGLARIIRFQFQLDPYDKNTLFLFCGKRTDRIKGLIWEGDGFLLLYKRIENGNFRWPRTQEEALEISADQYQMLMQGLEIVARHPIEEISCPEFSL